MVDECQDVKFERGPTDALVNVNLPVYNPAIVISNVITGPSPRIVSSNFPGTPRTCGNMIITFTGDSGY